MCYGKCQNICDRPCQKVLETQGSSGFTSLTLSVSVEPRIESGMTIEKIEPIMALGPAAQFKSNFIEYKMCA